MKYPKIRSFQGRLCKKGTKWHFCISCVLHSAFPFQTRDAVGSPSYLLPAPWGCLLEGGTQTAVGLGREIKPLYSSSQSALHADATEEDLRQSLNVGWKHPWARQLLGCVASLDKYQAEEAQEQGERGSAVCQPATQKAEHLHWDKIAHTSFKWTNIFCPVYHRLKHCFDLW